MTTIIVINAISSLLAGAGLAGVTARRARRARQATQLQPVYVTTGGRRRPVRTG
jgi:hypothetical protein